MVRSRGGRPGSVSTRGFRVSHDVFISHSTKDKGVADAICAALEAAEIRCWVAPRDIPPAAEWATSIVGALRTARVMVLVLSENAINSDHVKRELTVAAEAGVVIVPLKIDDTPLQGLIEYYLADTHWLDAMNPPTKAQIAKLVETVRAIVAARGGGAPGLVREEAVRPVREEAVRPVREEAAYPVPIRAKSRRLVAAVVAVAIVGGGVALWSVLRSTPEPSTRSQSAGPVATTSGLAGNTSESLPTYAEVVDAYPSSASTVAIEADITNFDVFPNSTSIVSFVGKYKGVKVRGGFYLTRDFTYDGSPGVLWESYGDTYIPQPPTDDWTAYEAFVHALGKKHKAFATLYESTYYKMLGPRFTSYLACSIGDLEVREGDMLTFDLSQRLVKVSAW